MEEELVEELRRTSHAAFGQRYRLECMLAIADSTDGIFSLGELATNLHVTPSNLQNPLASLLETGLITRMYSGDSRRKFYSRNDSSAWEWARELRDAARAVAAAGATT
jgi:DNA-binding transcriptional ArsR family regulator